MRQLLIKWLFRLLGNTDARIYPIQYLFGATTLDHTARKKRWEKALARLWKDKWLLDFLYYQSEVDKENGWNGKINKELAQGARIRTLFIIKSARRAYLEQGKGRRSTAEEQGSFDEDIKETEAVYKKIVDIKK